MDQVHRWIGGAPPGDLPVSELLWHVFVASRDVYTSPQGTNTIIIEYDHVCRPYVYQKTWYGKREIWIYPRSGFMETVSFGVEWLSEDKFRMIYDDKDDELDEEYFITIPE